MKKVTICLLVMMFGSSTLATTNEITVTLDMQVTKGSLQVSKSPGNQVIQMAGTRFYSAVYALTTTNQPMAKGAVGDLGWAYARNLATNGSGVAINLSFDSGATTNIQLLATEAIIFRFAPSYTITNMTAATSSGAADFELTVIEK